MKYDGNMLIHDLKEEDFMTFRWNADVHMVHRKTGEYKILNNHGAYIGEMRKGADEKYVIFVISEFNGGVEKIKETLEMIAKGKLKTPEYKTKEKVLFPYINHYQNLRHAA